MGALIAFVLANKALVVAIAAAVGSEVIGTNPKWKSNSWVQLIVNVGKKLLK